MRVGIDTGGTFTDLVLLGDDGRTLRLKVPSTPSDPAEALVDGLRRALEAAGGAHPSGVAMIQGYDVKTGALDWQFPVLVNGFVAAVVPRISLYSVGGTEYLVSFTHNAAVGADISAFTLP